MNFERDNVQSSIELYTTNQSFDVEIYVMHARVSFYTTMRKFNNKRKSPFDVDYVVNSQFSIPH